MTIQLPFVVRRIVPADDALPIRLVPMRSAGDRDAGVFGRLAGRFGAFAREQLCVRLALAGELMSSIGGDGCSLLWRRLLPLDERAAIFLHTGADSESAAHRVNARASILSGTAVFGDAAIVYLSAPTRSWYACAAGLLATALRICIRFWWCSYLHRLMRQELLSAWPGDPLNSDAVGAASVTRRRA